MADTVESGAQLELEVEAGALEADAVEASQPDAAQPDAANLGATELEAWLRLAFVGLPAARCRSALERWGSPAALLAAARRGQDNELLATPGLTSVMVERIGDAATRDIAKAM